MLKRRRLITTQLPRTATWRTIQHRNPGYTTGAAMNQRIVAAALTRTVLFVAVALLAGCGGESDSDGITPPPAVEFAGTYATQVTLVQNSCGSVTVQSLPTTVTHNAASGALTLVHGGTTFAGTVAADSTFNTTPRDVDVGDGNQYRVAITGRFGNRSFVADATVDRSGAGAPCQYVAHWVGSR
jgi:hypothetical protein